MRQTRAEAVSLIAAGGMAALLAACGNSNAGYDAADGGRPTSAAAFVEVDLTKEISFAGGQTTIAPSGTTTPQMDAAEVITTFKSSDGYHADLEESAPPQVQFGLYTNMSWGPEPSEDHDFTPYFQKSPLGHRVQGRPCRPWWSRNQIR